MGKKDEAISDYTRALELNPLKAVKIRTNRSNLLLETGRFREAVAEFDFLIAAEPKNFLFYYNRGFAKQYLNDRQGALKDYILALQLNPDDQLTKMQLQKLADKK
jgi:tetratricopeptide (TPR) repeat protein